MAAEFDEYLAAFDDQKLTAGHQRVVHNGHLPERQLLTGIGTVDVRVPKSRSREGLPATFRSSLVPPYVRRSTSVEAAVPWMYLHGVSTGKMGAAVAALGGRGSGSRAVGERGQPPQACLGRRVPVLVPAFACRRLGLRVGRRHLQRPGGGGRDRLCVLVVIGVKRPPGEASWPSRTVCGSRRRAGARCCWA